jgi:hypothetical protein
MNSLPTFNQFASLPPLARYSLLFRLQALAGDDEERARLRRLFTNSALALQGQPPKYPAIGILPSAAPIFRTCGHCGARFVGGSRSEFCEAAPCQAVRKETLAKRRATRPPRVRKSSSAPVGRPRRNDPAAKAAALALYSEGVPKIQIAVRLGVARMTLHRWLNEGG